MTRDEDWEKVYLHIGEEFRTKLNQQGACPVYPERSRREQAQRVEREDKDMSIKERMEVGQRWEEVAGGGWEITGQGRNRFFAVDEAGLEHDISYSIPEDNDWTLTHNADGTKADTSGEGVRKVEIDWRDSRAVEDFVDSAPGFKNYICWEDEDGYLHGFFKRKGGTGGFSHTHLSREQWDTGDWIEVKPVKLWFRDGGE